MKCYNKIIVGILALSAALCTRADKTVRTGGMSESPYVEKTAETIVKEGLGDYTVLFVGPWTGEKIRKVGAGRRLPCGHRPNRP